MRGRLGYYRGYGDVISNKILGAHIKLFTLFLSHFELYRKTLLLERKATSCETKCDSKFLPVARSFSFSQEMPSYTSKFLPVTCFLRH